jgi:uncharacterized transporter YbjL
MATREWMITKVSLALVSIITIVSICVGAANVVVNIQNDVGEVKEDQKTHKAYDEKKWEKISADVEENEDDINDLRVQNSSIQTMLTQILSRLDKGEANDLRIIDMLNNFEVSN